MLYYDGEECKGVFSTLKVRFVKGDDSNLKKSGSLDLFSDGVTMTVVFYENAKSMEIVFDSVEGAKQFCYFISLVSKDHNTEVCDMKKCLRT